MADLVFIDGKNLAYRAGWVHRQLSYKGKPTGLIYGFLNSLMKIMQKYPNSYIAVAWDGIPERRKIESAKGVADGIIASAYKQNREEKDPNPEMELVKQQIPELCDVLKMVGVKQGVVDNAEADDLIATWTIKCTAKGREVLIISSDKDYYQLLTKGVTMYDAMKDKYMTETSLMEDYGIEPHQWVDIGAIAGDTGDNIIGVPGWGEKTALKYVRENYSWEKVFEAVAAKTKRGKKEETLLQYKDRVKLAYSLKKMDVDLPKYPKLSPITWYNPEGLRLCFTNLGFVSLKDSIHHFSEHPRRGIR